MSCNHEFGIINNFSADGLSEYNEYNPQKYNCISVDDDYIIPILDKLTNLETINPCIPEKYNGLCYYGITIIPYNLLKKFIEILIKNENNSVYKNLINLLNEALNMKKYVIHYGI